MNPKPLIQTIPNQKKKHESLEISEISFQLYQMKHATLLIWKNKFSYAKYPSNLM